MTKPAITTRAGKGSALTWTEGDTNLTNLRDATITVTDGTNSKAIDLNGTIQFTAGTNIGLSVNSSTGVVTINNTASAGGISNLVEDTSPQLGGDLDVTGYMITSTGTNANIVLYPSSSGGSLLAYGPSFKVGSGAAATISSYNNSDLTLTAGSGNLALSGTKVTATALNYNEGAIYNIGTTGGTVAPNVTNGNVQKITLNSALTMNAFTSPVAGQSVTLIIYGGTAYTSITSTMKFAGGVKTLTGTAGCIDILTVYYDGTTYFASLGKGFA